MTTVNDKVVLKTQPSRIDELGNAWVVHNPRFGEDGTHYHTYGLLTPYFKGLAAGQLRGTRCVNERCPVAQGDGELWLPPRADCPDCHQPMVWAAVTDPRGYIYAYTHVARGGTGLEIECPYYQIDVKMDDVATILKSYLIDRRPIQIGDRVRARFRTGADATHTCLDLYWELER